MDWCEVLVHTTTQGSEVVSDILMEMGSAGCSVEDRLDVQEHMGRPDDWEVIDEDFIRGMNEDVLVRAWFPQDEKLADTLSLLRQQLGELRERTRDFDPGKLSLEVKDVRDEDWENNWRQYYKPFAVGERLLVRPVWEQAEEDGRLVVVMEPGMAFGTGTHETTYMCLELAQQYVQSGDAVMDIGCGTGILGIAALLLGAKSVLSVDRDEIALSATRQNAALNAVQEKMDIRHGDLLAGIEAQADLIFANIIAQVLIRMAADAFDHINPGGALICSGIILKMEQPVVDALKAAGFIDLHILRRGEWAAIAARRR